MDVRPVDGGGGRRRRARARARAPASDSSGASPHRPARGTARACAQRRLRAARPTPSREARRLSSPAAAEAPSAWTAFRLLLHRNWLEQTRDKTALFLKFGMNVFFSIVFGLVYYRMSHDQASLQNRTGILFFVAMNQAFGSVIGCSQVIPTQVSSSTRCVTSLRLHAPSCTKPGWHCSNLH